MAKWTREKIIREILRRESAGLSLSLGSSREGDDSKLYQAGSRVFGSWGNAIRAAGIAPERTKTHDLWTPSKILTRIRTLSRRKNPPRPGELKRRHAYLMHAARKCFGSWTKAVEAAGVDPQKLRRVMPWTEDRIIEAILTRALNGESLGDRSVEPRSLAGAAARVFGSWKAALEAAGIDPELANRLPQGTSSNYATACTENAGRSERPKRVRNLTGSRDTDARRQRRRPCPGGRWTEPEILDAILSRLRENRRMNAVAVDADDGPLYRAAKRRYGSWREALRAAGLDPDKHCAYPKSGKLPRHRGMQRNS